MQAQRLVESLVPLLRFSLRRQPAPPLLRRHQIGCLTLDSDTALVNTVVKLLSAHGALVDSEALEIKLTTLPALPPPEPRGALTL